MELHDITYYIKYGVGILSSFGVMVEFTPIKFKPISLLLKWVGSQINANLLKEMKQIDSKVDCVQTDLQNHIVENQRRDILEFASELRLGVQKTEEHFNYIMKLHDDYETYTKINGISNSQVDFAFDYIESVYKRCMKEDGFEK